MLIFTYHTNIIDMNYQLKILIKRIGNDCNKTPCTIKYDYGPNHVNMNVFMTPRDRVAEVARRHEGPLLKSLDLDQNPKH